MPSPVTVAVALSALLVYLVHKYLFVPNFKSPLSHIPNAHWSSAVSPLWILYHRQQQNDTPTVHAAHTRLGPIIRLAPNEISVNAVDGGIRTIYAGGFEKGDWYSNAFANYGVEPMFAMQGHEPHAKRKRMLSNIYAKSTLQASPAMTNITNILIRDRLVPRLRADLHAGRPVEFYDVFAALFMDFVAGYVFGLKSGSDFLRQPHDAAQFVRRYTARHQYTFWPQEMPRFTAFMSRIGLRWLLIPRWVGDANNQIEAWIMEMCVRAEAECSSSAATARDRPPEDDPTVYAQLRRGLLNHASDTASSAKSPLPSGFRLDLATELLDHTLAGLDTSSVTMTWLAWELSRPENAEWQVAVREELAPLGGGLDAKALDALPVCHAVLMETLRLHAAIPGNQPRVTPAGGATLAGASATTAPVPAGVRVQSQAYSLHRNPAVFPAPEIWDPARWLDGSGAARKREMARWFWAFGSGGRMCVGSNLAMLDMKAAIAGIWGRFATELVDDAGMVHNGGYMAGPRGRPGARGEGRRFLLLNIRELEGRTGREGGLEEMLLGTHDDAYVAFSARG